MAQFPNFAKDILLGNESVFILLLSIFSIGIGIGSLMCEKLSKGKLEVGLVVFGAIGLTIFGADLYFSSTYLHETVNLKAMFDYKSFITYSHAYNPDVYSFNHESVARWRLLADIALTGFFGGLYIVPLYALIQTRAEKSHQSRVIAANNILNALFMVVSAGFSILLLGKGLNIPQLFLATALLNVLVTIYLCIRQPEYFKTFIAWIKR